MAEKYFVSSVANLTAYDLTTQQVVLTGKSLLDTSIKTSLSKQEIRGSKGHALLLNYYHSGALDVNIINPTFDMKYLAAAVGSTLITGANCYTSENVVLGGGGAGTVTLATPLAVSGATAYGWVTLVDQITVERVAFTGSAFTCSGTSGDTVCVQYFALDSAAKSITIPASIVPQKLRVVLEADLVSNTQSAGVIGSLQVIIESVQFDGVLDISMKSDGVAQTPLHGTALAFSPPANSGCSSADVYARVVQKITNAVWYSGLQGLAIVSGDFSIAHPGTKTLVVKGIFSDGSVSTINNSLLAFSSSVTGKATVGVNTGVVTTVSTGDTVIHVTPVAAGGAAFDASVTCSVV